MSNATTKVLQFWFGLERPCITKNFKLWFSKDDTIDQQIINEFSDIHSLLSKNPKALGEEPEQLLSSVIVLDQFSRNMFRNNSKSFAYDTLAIEVTKSLHLIIKSGSTNFGPYEKMFTYMPLMHSEEILEQEFGIEVFTELTQGIIIIILLKYIYYIIIIHSRIS